MNAVTDIRYVGYAAKDLEAERLFYRDVWKLNEAAEENGLVYFAAAGAHPGAGIPGVLCSAKVVESLVDEDEKKQAIATARVDAL